MFSAIYMTLVTLSFILFFSQITDERKCAQYVIFVFYFVYSPLDSLSFVRGCDAWVYVPSFTIHFSIISKDYKPVSTEPKNRLTGQFFPKTNLG